MEINVKHATSGALSMFCMKYTTLLVVGLSLQMYFCVVLRLIILTGIIPNVFDNLGNVKCQFDVTNK